MNAHDGAHFLRVDELQVGLTLWPLLSRRLEVLDVTLRDSHLDLAQTDDGNWQLGPVRIAPAAQPEPTGAPEPAPWGIGVHSLSFENVSVAVATSAFTQELTLQSLTLADAFSWDPAQPTNIRLRLRAGDATVKLDAEAKPFQKVVAAKGRVQIDNLAPHRLAAIAPTAGVAELEVHIDADLDCAIKLDTASSSSLDLNGELRIADLRAADAQWRVDNREMRWQGEAHAIIDSQGSTDITLNGALALTEFSVSQPDDVQLVTIGALAAEQLRVTNSQTQIGELAITDVEASLQRLPDGGLRLPTPTSPLDTETTAEATEHAQSSDGPTAPPFGVNIDAVSLVGSNIVYFEDRSVTPAFSAALNIDELRAERLSTTSDEPAQLTLAIRTSETDRLRVTGTLAPFADLPSADLDIDLDSFDLSRISAYVPAYNIERGRLSLSGEHRVRDGVLDLQNNVVIEKLKLAGKSADENKLAASGAAMPLDVMLDLLRDRDGRIDVDVPITGNLSEIDVGLDQLVRQATQAALQKAALTYVKTALQPLGTILFAANLAGKAARTALRVRVVRCR